MKGQKRWVATLLVLLLILQCVGLADFTPLQAQKVYADETQTTATPTPMPTLTDSPDPTASPTPMPTNTPDVTQTSTDTLTPTPTPTPEVTTESTVTPEPTNTPAPTASPEPEATATPIPTLMPEEDTQAPTAPENLRSTGKTSTTADIVWDASNDNVGVTQYVIYNGTTQLGTTDGTTTFTVTNLSAGNNYAISVKAKDVAGNLSETSNILALAVSPLAPLNLVVVPTDKTLTVNWDASA